MYDNRFLMIPLSIRGYCKYWMLRQNMLIFNNQMASNSLIDIQGIILQWLWKLQNNY